MITVTVTPRNTLAQSTRGTFRGGPAGPETWAAIARAFDGERRVHMTTPSGRCSVTATGPIASACARAHKWMGA